MGMPLFGFLGLLLPVVFLALIVISVRAVVLSVTRPRRAVESPSCERCKYPVAGLLALTCPECGCDLRAVGIITPAMEMRRRGGMVGAIAGWSFFVLSVMVVASWLILMVTALPATRMGTATQSQTLTPASGAYTSVTISNTWGMSSATSGGIEMTLTLNDGSTHVIFIYTAAKTFTMRGPDGVDSAPATYDTSSIAVWFAAAGLDPQSASIASEEDELSRTADVLKAAPYSLSTTAYRNFTAGVPTFTSTASAGPGAGAWAITAGAIWIGGPLIWIVGIVLIVRRRRRLLREWAPDAPGPGLSPIP